MKANFLLLTPILLILLSACATSFPEARPGLVFDDGLSAEELFEKTLTAHGGDMRDDPGDLNLATQGEWKRLVQRLQPIVSDAGFRVTTEERYQPSTQLYVVRSEGPEGVKTVVQAEGELRVYYNGQLESDPVRLRATAMTHDAFVLFHFGPTLVKHRATDMVRLADEREGGVSYRRLLATLRPGFGEAEEDQVVLWIHPETELLFRVHITLNGFESTQGAHVDTTFLAYENVGPYVLPSKFEERVRGPVRIGAHEWWTEGFDRNRGWALEDVDGPEFEGAAAESAVSSQ